MVSTTLYCTEGKSDKIYQIALEKSPGGWLVNFAYGRRGSTLTTGTKTKEPVTQHVADRIFDKLVREKVAKGYTTGDVATSYSTGSKKLTSIRPQLLNAVGAGELERLLTDDEYLLQPKLDGRRLMILKKDGKVTGINRKGIECGVPQTIIESALALPGDYLLEQNGQLMGHETYKRRLVALLNLLAGSRQSSIQWVQTHERTSMKKALFDKLKAENAEGVVFKRRSSPYSPGRPESGGDHLKFKFVETASVIVSRINQQRSAAISLWKEDKLVEAGNVTIPPNHPVPEVGQIAEVRYLYAMPDSGSLYQPVYLGVREDIDPSECLEGQLKYKAA